MKNKAKVFISLGVILFILGIGLFVVSLVMVGGDFRLLSTEQFESKSYQTEATGIRSIELESFNGDIKLAKSPDAKIHLTYSEGKKNIYEIKVTEGVLTIVNKDTKKWYERIGINLNFPEPVVLSLPENMESNLKIKTFNGAIDANDISLKGDAALETSNGSFQIADTDLTGSLSLLTFNGEIHLKQLGVGTGLTAKSSNGSIRGTLKGELPDFSIQSHTVNGSNSLPENMESGAKALTISTFNGEIKIDFLG